MTTKLTLNEEIILYSNALERQNFKYIKNKIEEELDQIAKNNLGVILRTEKLICIEEQTFKAKVQISGKVMADKIDDIKKKINEIQTKINEIRS